MYFELQLSSDVFGKIVRNRLKAISVCPNREFNDSDAAKTRLVVDRVVIGDTTLVQREKVVELVNGAIQSRESATQTVWIFSPTLYTSFTVPFLQVKQEVQIHVVRSIDLDTNGPNPTPPYKTLTIYPVFNIALTASKQTQGGGPVSLSYSLAQVDFGLLFYALSPAERADIEQLIAAVKLPPTAVDLGPLSGMLKRPVSIVNAGITCDDSTSAVILRMEFDVYKSPLAMSADFFQTGPPNLLDGKQWAMLVDVNLILADATAKAKAALTGDSKVKLNSGPSVSWDAAGTAIDISAGVELVDACPFFIDDIDMDVDVDIRVSFSVPATNTYRTRHNITGSPSDFGEEFACAITAALLWPFIGPIMLKDEDVGEGIGFYFLGLAAGPVIMFFGIIGAIESKSLSKDISDDLGDACKKIDDENYQCDETLNLQMALTPGFNSRLDVEQVRGLSQGLAISGTVSNLGDFRLGVLDGIHVQPFHWDVVGRCTGNGKSNFRVANRAVITVHATEASHFCQAILLNDSQNEFILQVSDAIYITPRFTTAYTASPYPLRIRVITNRGVRTITLAPPAPITAEQSSALDTARLRAHSSCYFWEKFFTNIEKLKWLPDPPFALDHGILHYWQIAVRGLQARDALRVVARERNILTAQPSRQGVAHITLIFDGEEAPDEISLELLGRGKEDEGMEREISLQQVLFVLRASFPISGSLKQMHFEGSRQRSLLIIDEDREMAWDVTNSLAPALLHSLPANRQERGVASLPLGELPIQNGRRVGARRTEGLQRALQQLGHHAGRSPIIGSPRLGGFEETLYLRSEKGAVLYDITEPSEPRIIQTFEQSAWFEGLALGGDLLVRQNRDGKSVDLYAAVSNLRK